MDYVQNKNVSMINEHYTRAISEKKNPKGNKNESINKMHCRRQIFASMFRSMAVS